MLATHFKQVKTEATKDWEHCGMLVWNIPQVSRFMGTMILYENAQLFTRKDEVMFTSVKHMTV